VNLLTFLTPLALLSRRALTVVPTPRPQKQFFCSHDSVKLTFLCGCVISTYPYYFCHSFQHNTLAPALLLPALQFQPVFGQLPNSADNGLVKKKQPTPSGQLHIFVFLTHGDIMDQVSHDHMCLK